MRAAGWAGESRRFGEGVAILVGDLAFVMADQLLIDAPRDAWVIWNELRTELNIGQLLDIVGSVQGDRRLDKAERICRYKSGKYTVERPLHLGAVLAAPDRAAELLPALSAYGLPLGDAFQMRDDVMGAFGDEARDRQAGRRRPPRGQADAAAGPGRGRGDTRATRGARRSRLAAISTTATSTAMQQVIVDTGALAALEAQIAAAHRPRRSRRSSSPRSPRESRDELIALAQLRQLARRLKRSTAANSSAASTHVDRDLYRGGTVGLSDRQPGLADLHPGGLLQGGDVCRHLRLVARRASSAGDVMSVSVLKSTSVRCRRD